MNHLLILSVAKSIKKLRIASSLSQEELASRSGLDRTYISGVERGVRNITLESLDSIISALSVSHAEFFREVISAIDQLSQHTKGNHFD